MTTVSDGCQAKRALRVGWLVALCLSGAASAVAGAEEAPLDVAAEGLRLSLAKDIGQALTGARTLHERLAERDLEGARQAWIAARVRWERAEVFTGGFVPDLDEKIASWPNALSGFHAIEAKLFTSDETDMAAEANTLVFYRNDLAIKIYDAPSTRSGS